MGQLNTQKQREGKGWFKYPVGDYFYGGWKMDVFHGQGVYIFHSGEIYDGLLIHGMKEGQGVYYYDQGKVFYDGEWSAD